MLSNHLILWRPLLLLPSIFPSIRVFSSELALCIMWPNYWSFSNSPSNEYSVLISFRTDWFDLFAVQGTLPGLAIPLKTRRKWDKIYETTFSGTENSEIRLTAFGIGMTSSGKPGAILILLHRKVSLARQVRQALTLPEWEGTDATKFQAAEAASNLGGRLLKRRLLPNKVRVKRPE